MSETSQSSGITENPLFIGLSPVQIQALGKLMSTKTLAGAARAVGVSESTIHAWLGQPAFRAALHALFRARFDLLNLEAIKLGKQAFAVLETVMNDPTAPAMARVQAASRVIDTIHRSYELVGITERLDKLEGLLERGHGQA